VYATSNRLWLYDVAHDSISEVAHGSGIRAPQFVNDHVISFLQGSTNAVLRTLDLKTNKVDDVFSEDSGIAVYGWSPDRMTIAYITTDAQAYPHLRYRLVGSEVPTRPVATLARAFGRGSIAADQVKIQFSPDGADVLVVYTPADGSSSEDTTPEQSQLQVRTLDGSLAFAADMADSPTMGTWSVDGSRVYFRTDQGARAWRADTGIVEGVRGGIRWFDPWPSPDGRLLGYDTGADSSAARVGVIELKTGARRVVSAAGRFHPVFANANVMWVQKLRACSTCEGATAPTNEVYALDVRNGKEVRLALGSLVGIDVLYR